MSEFKLKGQHYLNPLQIQVIRLGKCPVCHTKSLETVYEDDDSKAVACEGCYNMYVIGVPLE